MTQKIAVVIIHGIGKPPADFADSLIDEITRLCSPKTGADVIIRPIHWSPVLQGEETRLISRVVEGGTLRFPRLRGFMIDFIADAIAYQITPFDRTVYDSIHGVFARTLRELAVEAGPEVPLCIIAHSLGTIITSNYLYDLQHQHLISDEVRAQMAVSPLERGETLTLMYTMGSPIALWSMRYPEFGKPITFPPPELSIHYPDIPYEWVNLYDPDDVVGYPLKTLNEQYGQVVTEDREVNVGNLLEQWTPISHLRYWGDMDVIRPIADQIVKVWEYLNPEHAEKR